MNAASNNGPDNGTSERKWKRLYDEVTTLKAQRDELQRQLAECRRENSELRARLEGRQP